MVPVESTGTTLVTIHLEAVVKEVVGWDPCLGMAGRGLSAR